MRFKKFFSNKFLTLTINFFKNILNKFNFIIEFCLSIALAIFSFNIFYFKKYAGYFDKINLIFTFIFVILIAFLIYYDVKRIGWKVERTFLYLAIPISIIYSVFLLPGNVPDERLHFFRAYSISDGNLITNIQTQKEAIPGDIMSMRDYKLDTYDQYKAIIGEKTNYTSEIREEYNPAGGYPFIMYVFPSIAILIGKILGLNIYLVFNLARIFNIIFFLICGYYSIKYIPFGKLIVFAFLLNPLMIQEAASVASDAFINATTIFFISFSIYLMFLKREIILSEKIIYIALIIAISFAKYIYFPLSFISILLFWSKGFKEKKNKIFIILTLILSVILGFLSYYIGTLYEDVRPYVLDNNISSKGQIAFILNNPLGFVKVLIRNLYLNGETYNYQLWGGSLGFLEINNRGILVYMYLFILIFSAFLEKSEISLSKLQKVYILMICFGIGVLVFSGLYLTWTPVGHNLIDGIQGRYFIPVMLLPFLCLIMKNKYISFEKKNVIKFISVFLIYYNCITMLNIIRFFS